MHSVEFIVPTSIDLSLFDATVRERFPTASIRDGEKFVRDSQNIMSPVAIRIYEVAYHRSNLDPLVEFAKSCGLPDECLFEIKVDGETFFIDTSTEQNAVAESPVVADTEWPNRFDVAIQTVIGPELHAAQDLFGVDPIRNVTSVHGTLYYKGTISQNGISRTVVITAQNAAGNQASAMVAERIITQWNPRTIFLMGICAGRKGKCRIGDVITPRVVVDDTEAVVEANHTLKRPRIFPPPHVMGQQLQNFRYPKAIPYWHELLKKNAVCPTAPAGIEAVYSEHLAVAPSKHEAAIYSSDLLLRDAEYLEAQASSMHQQIRVGEMEAAGFGSTCNERATPTPWFIVRGVSDFGDEFKSDDFHVWAAYSAAAYLHTLIKYGINFSLLP